MAELFGLTTVQLMALFGVTVSSAAIALKSKGDERQQEPFLEKKVPSNTSLPIQQHKTLSLLSKSTTPDTNNAQQFFQEEIGNQLLSKIKTLKTVDEKITGILVKNPDLKKDYSYEPIFNLDIRDYISVKTSSRCNTGLIFPKLPSEMQDQNNMGTTKNTLYNSETRKLQTNFDYLDNHGRIVELDLQYAKERQEITSRQMVMKKLKKRRLELKRKREIRQKIKRLKENKKKVQDALQTKIQTEQPIKKCQCLSSQLLNVLMRLVQNKKGQRVEISQDEAQVKQKVSKINKRIKKLNNKIQR